MQEHEYTVSRELLNFTGNPQLIKCLQSCLALVIFYHIFLIGDIRLRKRKYVSQTDGLKSHPGMNFVNLYRKFIFDSLDLEKERMSSSKAINGENALSNLAADS